MAFNFNGNTPKKILYNGLNVAKLVYNGVVVWLAKVLTKLTGYPITLTNSVGDDLVDYKVYGESVQDGTPTPDTPIEIESVGDKSPNLINWDYLLSDTTITKVENGYYSNTYTHAFSSTSNIVKHLKSVLKPDVTYTLSRVCVPSLSVNGAAIGRIAIQSNEGDLANCTYWGGLKSTTFTLTKEQIDSITKLTMFFYIKGVTLSELQLTEGNTVLPYEPYGYRVPIKVSGKNIFNPNQTPVSIGAYLGMLLEKTNYTLLIKLKEGKSVPAGVYFGFAYWSSASLAASANWFISNGKLNYNQNAYNFSNYYRGGVVVYSDSGNTKAWNDIIEAFDIYLVKGYYTTTLTYEPYYEPITTNIYLNEPLRKVGDKSDYIDFENSKVVRNVKKLQMKNAIQKYTWLNKVGVAFGSVLNGTYSRRKGLCNRETRFTANGDEQTTIWIGVDNPNLYWIGILDYLGFTTLEEMNEWLTDNPTYILYGSNKTIEEPIELPTIPTHEGTNIIEVDTTIKPSNMEVQYYAKGV